MPAQSAPSAVVVAPNAGYVILIAAAAAMGGFLFGYDTAVINGAVLALKQKFNASSLAIGLAVSLTLLGSAFGAFIVGPMADRRGRIYCMILASILFTISGIGSGLPFTLYDFIFWRILGGIAIGMASVIAPAYIAECSPADMRGRLGSLQQLAIVVGIFAALLGNFAIAASAGSAGAPFWGGFEAWRWMFWSEVPPAVMYGIFALVIPESPRFLVAQGRHAEARVVLARMIGPHASVKVEEIARTVRRERKPSLDDLRGCRVFIVTVPTPIDEYKRPDLTPLVKSSESVGKVLKKGDVVVYESTVYPGCTEEVCVPILERVSGLKFNKDFFCGYSPERINPGDKQHRLTTIRKVTSGSTPEVAEFVDSLYRSIVTVGTHKASSIKVAEAAKVIENTQRDVNIALINELALIFNRLGIDTEEVLLAAGSKWNFLPFRPGLVGGHCIGVDPYYLTHKAQAIGYHPEMILAGRRINDNMGTYVAQQIALLMIQHKIQVKGSRILVMGLTFKENCPDVRNTKIVDVVRELEKFGAKIDVCDPWADPDEAEHEYGLRPVKKAKAGAYDAVVMGVAHQEFRRMGVEQVRTLGKKNHVLYDIKYVFKAHEVDGRL